jgi:hypothetical protein
MPEAPEIETEKLHEAIHEELEKEGGTLLRRIALTTACLAALAALASLKAGGTVNEALAKKTEAARLQAEASDQWAYYQAKGVKGAVQDAIRASWAAAGKAAPADLDEKAARYAAEQKEIADKAREKEKERDAREREADALMHEHHRHAIAVALFQVAIALGAVGALTKLRLVWSGSLLVGAAGLLSFAGAFLTH